jgi:hypothetical protein
MMRGCMAGTITHPVEKAKLRENGEYNLLDIKGFFYISSFQVRAGSYRVRNVDQGYGLQIGPFFQF